MLDEQAIDTVMFVIAERKDEDGNVGRRPIGTAFLVSVPTDRTNMPAFLQAHGFIVTAAHVVESGEQTWIRRRLRNGAIGDVAIEWGWLLHPTKDVAVTPYPSIPFFGAAETTKFVSTEQFADAQEARPRLGDPVYFIGLVSGIPAMSEALIPMVRPGLIGRLYQEKVPVRRPGDQVIQMTAHLIDCRAYKGFSGSPCFAEVPFTIPSDAPTRPPATKPGRTYLMTVLFGMIAAHFDDWVDERTTGDIFGTVRAPVSTGIGIVVPCEDIRETLDSDEIMNYRTKAQPGVLFRNHPLTPPQSAVD
jgi:hypothetical protein